MITPLTSNVKLGDNMATSYRSVGDAGTGLGTCPSTCPLLNNGCYTRKYHTAIQQNRSRTRYDAFERFLEKGAKIVRLHTTGDFFKTIEGGYALDTDYLNDFLEFAQLNLDVTFYTYTHDISKFLELGYTADSMPRNFYLLASVESAEEAFLARAAGFKTARVITTLEQKADNEVFCPYDYYKHKKIAKNVTCSTCRLCFNSKNSKNIAFMKH